MPDACAVGEAADGRRRCSCSASSHPTSLWLLVAGLAGHGLKDLWQHRTGFVANTRWWPPFCATVDFVAAALIAAAIVVDLHLGW